MAPTESVCPCAVCGNPCDPLEAPCRLFAAVCRRCGWYQRATWVAEHVQREPRLEAHHERQRPRRSIGGGAGEPGDAGGRGGARSQDATSGEVGPQAYAAGYGAASAVLARRPLTSHEHLARWQEAIERGWMVPVGGASTAELWGALSAAWTDRALGYYRRGWIAAVREELERLRERLAS